MALVKTAKMSAAPKHGPAKPAPVVSPRETGGGEDRLSERIAAAAEELASGFTEASAAAEQLRRAMEQIAAGAEQAAGASQEQLAAIRSAVASLSLARAQAEESRRRTDAVQVALAESAVQITTSIRAIERNADRQNASLAVIAELERRARDIGEITRVVSRISDETNLLALNAAIEAARAGDHGRGFAVVADEVRALAEASDKSARDVQGLAETIQQEVQGVVAAVQSAAASATAEARAGGAVVGALDSMRLDLKAMAQGSTETLTAAIEAETAATEAQRGAEQVATAAEEQSAGANEAQAAVRQQAQSLEQGQIAAKSIARLAEELRSGGVTLSSAEQIAASSEELSATVQELSSAATEVMAAVDQISRGAQLQAAAAQQTSAALGQIESGARLAQRNAGRAREQVEVAKTALSDGEAAVGRLALGMESAVSEVGGALAVILRLETMGRRIVAIVDEITLATVQTSMLAVSGSVEAARAGGAGRGFAVVSGDIRNLARGAAESVARIRETVLGVLDQIAVLRRELEQVIAAAEIEAQNNRSVMSGFDKIKLEVEALREASGAISAGAEDILSAAMQTASGARQIAAAAEQASVATREAAAASAEQARSAEDLAAAIEEIASLADALRQENA